MNPLRLSPSASSRWLKCRASVGYLALFETDLPPEEEKIYTSEGTTAHALGAAELLLGGMPSEAFPDPLMEEYVRDYAQLVQSAASRVPNTEIAVEETIPIFYGGTSGTPDVTLVNPRLLSIFDLKYGRGVEVQARDNSQLLIYARSKYELVRERYPRIKKISLNIFQPRSSRGKPLRNWTFTVKELLAHTDPIGQAVQEIRADPLAQTFVVEPEGCCRFCPVKAICLSYNEALQEPLGDVGFDIVPDPEPEAPVPVPEPLPLDRLTVEQLGRLLTLAQPIRQYLDAAVEYAQGLISLGQKVPGWKEVPGRSKRRWSDEQKAGKLLAQLLPQAELFKRTLVSAPEALRLLKAAQVPKKQWAPVERLIVKPEGRPTLVPDSDPRESLDSATEDFETLPE